MTGRRKQLSPAKQFIHDRFLILRTSLRPATVKFSMSDHMGRSFSAKLDGSDATYNGSTEFDSVSLKKVDDNTIEESEKKDGKVVKISRWTVASDGKTIHVRFDDTHGHVQEQDGHKVP
jgi:hypothetical protein